MPTGLAATLPGTALWALVGVAALWDVVERRIPNRLILVGLLLGCGFQAQSGGLVGLGLAVLGAGAALAILIVPFALRKLGGGDVKLAMVVGAFLGWEGAVHIILIGTVLHGLLALGLLFGGKFAASLGRAPPDLSRIPHAVGFALATVVYTSGLLRLF